MKQSFKLYHMLTKTHPAAISEKARGSQQTWIQVQDIAIFMYAGLAAACLLAVSDACLHTASGWAAHHGYQQQSELAAHIEEGASMT